MEPKVLARAGAVIFVALMIAAAWFELSRTAAHPQQQDNTSQPASETSLREDLADASRLVLAGTIDDVVVGYAVVRTEVLRDGGRLGVLTDIYVEPEARAVGVGEVLVDEVLRWCRELGCTGVDGLALPGNRSTKNFFETFGFTARAIVVHRRL